MVLHGLVAQRLAQGTHNPWVLGSNPGRPTYDTGFRTLSSGVRIFALYEVDSLCLQGTFLDFQNKKKVLAIFFDV